MNAAATTYICAQKLIVHNIFLLGRNRNRKENDNEYWDFICIKSERNPFENALDRLINN